MDAPITKRLIISGLTSSISAEDISHRLTTFGIVKAADGFGFLDGVGQPRKFGYVTLETTVGKLSKCMNLLSGSTWKGAKLRFGEAKPDFGEKIALENKKAAEEPPKKKRKRHTGTYAEDMTPVSPENAAQRPGWKVSPLGRITRPVKLRPAHPLIEPQEEKKPKKPLDGKHDGKKPDVEKKKKRVKDPDTRARRKTIDMTKYGSTHLKGMFLDLEVPISTRMSFSNDVVENDEESSSSSDEGEDNIQSHDVVAALTQAPPPEPSPLTTKIALPMAGPSKYPSHLKSTPPTNALSAPTSSNAVPASFPEENTDVEQEKTKSLHLLMSLFGDDDDDWVGQESVGSDIDVDELAKGDVMLMEEDDGVAFEIVPKGSPSNRGVASLSQTQPLEDHDDDEDEQEEVDQDKMAVDEPTTRPTQPIEKSSQKATLKDLFAPREAEAGFSLLGHLDLDLEFDEEVAEQSNQQPQQPILSTSTPASLPVPINLQSQTSQAPLVLNLKQALFFPVPSQDHAGSIHRARQRDVFDLVKDNGWNWRDPAVGFYRTGTEEDIRARWEESKGDLTRDWKRRCREAGKVNRRKRGGGDDNEY